MNAKAIAFALCTWILGLGLMIPLSLRAQVSGGTLSGTITDPSGAAVPNAQVEIKNSATGITRTVVTNSDGLYSAANLLPGNYEITISATGFNTEIKKGITINVGSQPVFNLALQIGTVANSVEVTTEAPIVQLTSSDISATVSASTVRELPLNGRSWTDLAALQPGVDTIHTQPDFSTGSDRGNRGFGQQLTISGARPQQNNYRLDGISLNDYANGAPGSVLGGNLGVDAIQEFSVLTSNYSAEYGKTSGGVVNAITRSGTNAFHGSAYEFLRNSALDARNYFEDPTQPKAPFRRNQFGGTLGGPILKDRTFFFVDYEGNRQSKGIANVNTVPSPTARQGILYCTSDDVSNGVPGCTSTTSTHTVTVDPAVQKYLALYPTSPDCGADTCQVVFSAQQVVTENFFTTRIDHKFSDKDSVFGTYLFDKSPYNSPDSMGNVQLESQSSRQIVAVEETHTFTPTFVNAVRFGYNHEFVNNDSSFTALNPTAADTSLGAFAGRNAAVVNVNGVISQMPGGVGGLPTYLYGWNSFQVYDDAFWTKGTHSIKFGFAAERMLLQATALTDPNGIWNFPDLQHFLTNNPSKFAGGVASTLTPRNLRQSIFGAYLQDDWRVRPNLTLNLGLRYEMATVPTETDGKIVNLRNLADPAPVCGVVPAGGGCSGAGSFFSNPTLHNFEPRLGFAWDPLGNGRLAVRGGAGLFDVLPLPYQFILLETQAAPFFAYTSLNNPAPGSFFNGLPSPLPSASLRSTYVDSNPKRNYVTQWNLNLQYQLTPDLAAMVAYVGSRGVHQPFRVDEANLVMPTKTSAGYLWPQVDIQGNIFTPNCNATDPNAPADDPNLCAPPNPINQTFGSVRGMFYQGRSYFNALEFQLAKRMSHGFQAQGTFTWSKSIDTSSATLAGDAFGNSISSLNWFDMGLNRGLSDFNVGRTLVINGTWQVPTPKTFSGPGRWLADGWELGAIFTVSDGVPFTATWGTGSDPATTQSSDDFAYPDRLGGPGCNTLTNPGHPENYIKTQCFGIPAAPDMTFWSQNCDPAPPNSQPADPTQPPFLAAFPQCFNLRGNAGRNILIGPGVTNLDFSVFKNNAIKRISENFNIQFRVEMFNVLNHPNFAPPGPGDGNTDIYDASGVLLSPDNGGTAGVLLRTTTPERQIQFALKVIF
jgi:Carboxypeptidase regulatory-like domain/TonB dependent receptor-like, beta-barrel/TonB-dependent Receptor Plug Domain